MAQTSWGQYYAVPNAGTGNPGGLRTDVEEPFGAVQPLGGWTALSPGTTPTPVWSSNGSIPFSFTFNGSPYTSYKVSTSGVLTFSTSAVAVPAAIVGVLPRTDIPDNSIYVGPLSAPGANDQVIAKTFGSAPNRQHWVQFASFNQPANGATAFVYWAIVLEETTNKIYIVDQRSTNNTNPPSLTAPLTIGLQYTATTALNMPGSPNIISQTQTTVANDASDNVYHFFAPGTQPTNQISFSEIKNSRYIVGTNPVFFRGSFKNLGSQSITSFVLTYSIDGTTVSDTFRGRTISSLSSDTFIFRTSWTPRNEGVFPVKIKASFVNGSNITDLVHDSITKDMEVIFRAVPRVSLHEGFTSSTCPPCVQGNIVLNGVLGSKPSNQYAVIKYQQDYPAPGNDPNFTAESGSRHDYYGITGIPHLAVNGTKFNDNTSGYNPSLFEEYLAIPSQVELSGTYKVIRATRTVNASITYKALRNYSQSTIAAHAVITEKTVRHALATNGETEFKHVMRKMITGVNGQNIAAGLQKDSLRTINVSYTFPATTTGTPINYDSLDVVVFLQDMSTKEVLNAANAELDRDRVAVKVGTVTAPSSIVAITTAPYNFGGLISNSGLDTVRSLHLNYRIGNGPILTDTISGLSLLKLQSTPFNHTKLWNPTVAGFAVAKFWVTNVNDGNANTLSGDTTYRIFRVVEDVAPRLGLNEVFSSCFGQLSGVVAPLADSIAAANPSKLINLRYQFNLGTNNDPLQNTFGISRQGFYRITGTPAYMVNGRNFPIINGFNVNTFADFASEEPAFCNITGTVTRTGQRFNVNATVTPTATLSGSGILAYIAFAEKGVTHTQGTNGETVFTNVVRRTVASFPYVTSGFNATTPYPLAVSQLFPNAQPTIPIKYDSIIAVVVIQDTASKVVLNTGVLNLINSVDDVLDASDVSVYPNPAKNSATLSFDVLRTASVNVRLMNSIGQVVRSYNPTGSDKGQFTQELDLKGLAPGIYNININAGGQQTQQRLVIE